METTGLPPLPGVDSDRDAKAVIRRMRMQGRQPDTTLSVQSFNELIVAAKDDVIADEAAAKDELNYYRNLLDVAKDKPLLRRPPSRPTLTPPDLTAPSTVKLPSLKKESKDPRITNKNSTLIATPSPVALQSNQLERPPTRSKADKSLARENPIAQPPPGALVKAQSLGGTQLSGASATRPLAKQPSKVVKTNSTISDDGPQNEPQKEPTKPAPPKASKRPVGREPPNNEPKPAPPPVKPMHSANASENNPPPKDLSKPGATKRVDADKKPSRKKKVEKPVAGATFDDDNQKLEKPATEGSNPTAVKSMKPPRSTKPFPSSAVRSSLDCVDTFDDDEPEMDAAPVWRDDMMSMDNGYGSDDDGM